MFFLTLKQRVRSWNAFKCRFCCCSEFVNTAPNLSQHNSLLSLPLWKHILIVWCHKMTLLLFFQKEFKGWIHSIWEVSISQVFLRGILCGKYFVSKRTCKSLYNGERMNCLKLANPGKDSFYLKFSLLVRNSGFFKKWMSWKPSYQRFWTRAFDFIMD